MWHAAVCTDQQPSRKVQVMHMADISDRQKSDFAVSTARARVLQGCWRLALAASECITRCSAAGSASDCFTLVQLLRLSGTASTRSGSCCPGPGGEPAHRSYFVVVRTRDMLKLISLQWHWINNLNNHRCSWHRAAVAGPAGHQTKRRLSGTLAAVASAASRCRGRAFMTLW
jgi:hypothetical protein